MSTMFKPYPQALDMVAIKKQFLRTQNTKGRNYITQFLPLLIYYPRINQFIETMGNLYWLYYKPLILLHY